MGARKKHRDPIAIVGIGCRFPGGGNDPQSFWRLLSEGIDAVREIPPDRWSIASYYDETPGTPGKTNSRWGGFIEGIDQFDAGFFGISPREAVFMDPQQRLLLEVAAEALEDAGQPAERVSGTETGVFVGVSSWDYAAMQQTSGDVTAIDTHSNTGGALSIIANRISYFFDLRGTSVAVDTACSSALVAVHFACQSLWRGESSMALAGGVNVLIKPEPFLGFSRLSMLSADGRCKAFDKRADGFVRGEGAGMVVMKPLSVAKRDGDRIYAAILGSASNQDGHTSSMVVPSVEGQSSLLRQACREAGISPAEVQYVEAHGTGTPVGDPVEARALGQVLSEGRASGQVCLIGSVKTNIGHLEPAAGVAGLIKVALCLKHRSIPASLHFREAPPEIPLEELQLRVVRSLEPWPEGPGPGLAGVNSFGFGGANAHVIVTEVAQEDPAPMPALDPSRSERLHLFPLSARSEPALVAAARALDGHLEREAEGQSLEDIVHTLSARRTHHEHRLAVIGRSREEVISHLKAFAAGEMRSAAISGRIASDRKRPRCVFVCSGQGPQWWGMGRQLLEEEPVFRAVIQQCDEGVRAYSGWSLWKELTAGEAASRMNQTAIAQPALFSIQVALAALYRSWGIVPDALIGHSVGEVASAHLAGALDLETALRVIFERGRSMDVSGVRGRMLAAGVSQGEARELVSGLEERVSLAAINTPSSVTLSGDGEALERIARALEERGLFARFLRVEYAFHSPQVEPTREDLLRSLRGIRPGKAELPMMSTVTARPVDGEELDSEYWWRNVRNPVLFADGIDALLSEGYDLFLELGPHPVLSSAVLECAQSRKRAVTALSSLRREEDERFSLLRSLASMYAGGAAVNWSGVSPGGRFVRTPTYPWQHERYWTESERSRRQRLGPGGHPLLGERIDRADPVWESKIDPRVLRYLGEHRVQGQALLPAAGYLEMAVAAAHELQGRGALVVENLEFARACFLENVKPTTLQLTADSKGSFHIHSKPDEGTNPWIRLASGRFRPVGPDPAARSVDLEPVRARSKSHMGTEECYRRLEAVGLSYGPAFQGVEEMWVGEDEALARIRAPETLEKHLSEYWLHPALLDACLHALFFAVRRDDEGSDRLFLPVSLDRARVQASVSGIAWSYVRVLSSGSRAVEADIIIIDACGGPLVELRGLRCHAVDGGRTDRLDDLIYHYVWERLPGKGSLTALSPSLSSMPSPRRVTEELGRPGERIEAELGLTDYTLRMEAKAEPLCAAYIVNALRELGFFFLVGQRVRPGQLIEDLRIPPVRGRALGRFFEILVEDGIFERRSDDEWVVRRIPESFDLESECRELLRAFPAAHAEWSLLESCGRNLAEVLRGKVDPLELIFPEGSLELAEQVYRDSPHVRYRNLMATRAVSAVAAALPAAVTLRILEIGAGTGGLTQYLLRALPPGRVAYTFTDVSKHFLVQAQEKFRDRTFVDYRLLDIERDPREQGFEPHSFDIVLASEVLHATADVRQSLRHARELLSPQGLLLLNEGIRPSRWIDLVFGLTEGWWKFTDRDLRPSYPLLSLAGWERILGELGFTEISPVCLPGGDRAPSAVLLARALVNAEVSGVANQEPGAEVAAGTWLILGDRGGIASRLAERLGLRGQSSVFLFPGDRFRRIDDARYEARPDESEGIAAVVRKVLGASPGLRGIVHLWSADIGSLDQASKGSLDQARSLGCLSVLSLAQALGDVDPGIAPRLWLVTRHTESVFPDDGTTAVLQAPLWGLGRVMANEIPKLRPSLVDLSERPDESELEALCAELLGGDAEDEIALRGASRYVHRFVRESAGHNVIRVNTGEETEVPPFRLETPGTGVLDQLALRVVERRPPGPGEIEIEVAAAGLNFSDVMKALGIYPGLPDGPIPLGIECAGRVHAVGPDVDEFHPGDEVMAVAPFSFGRLVRTSAELAARKPSRLRLEEAATVPVAFLTADYALNHLGHLSPGERVLIHAASGGVGLAAIQLARLAGAEIFATAGTPRKRSFLRSLGVHPLMDSRSLDFADQILEATNGEGVDVVLNSLAGSAIDKGLEVLRDHGRFLEIGKRDIYQDSRLGLRAFRKNLSFLAIDLDRALRVNRRLFGSLFRELSERFEKGDLTPLPHRVFPIADAVDAFRAMAKARHVGKLVLSLQEQDLSLAPSAAGLESFRQDATYLVSGGLGGFGLALAAWLIERGARHLVLMGRGGAGTDEARRGVAALRESGAEVKVFKGDVSRWEEVAAVLAEIDRFMPPLRGVFHAAMVLSDSLLLNMTSGQLEAAWAPKVEGGFNLHLLTRDRPLDHFVLFSSMASIFGATGQGNYVSANRFLESLAFHRRAQGLPALAVSWGYLGEVGFVARHPEVGERFESMGIRSFSPREALSVLGRLLQRKTTHAAVVRVDWARFRRVLGAVNVAPRFQRLVEGAYEGDVVLSKRTDGAALRNALATLAGNERRDLLQTALLEQVARVLGTSPEKLDLETKMTDLGFDSLMAVELRNWVENTLQLSLPTTELLRGPSVSQLVDRLLEQIEGSEEDSSPAAPVEKRNEPSGAREYAEQLAGQVDALSDEEVDALLLQVEGHRQGGEDLA
jgi:acyl transferase domain-containing protein/NADPH:quinone reductase-like Zn-dependent oxidoreductase/ubiquinone/menaquinone biosynthesis C-methylase UbiE/acyl carrier protein